MNISKHIVALSLALSWATFATAAAPKLDTESRVQLQSAMRMHIDRVSVQGNYPNLDLKSGAVRMLHPAASHPMILSMGTYYVLCADFRDDAGKPVNVDFYVARKDKGFAIFQVEVANRAPLEALMKSGAAVMLE